MLLGQQRKSEPGVDKSVPWTLSQTDSMSTLFVLILSFPVDKWDQQLKENTSYWLANQKMLFGVSVLTYTLILGQGW